jgi:hypothetical protein
MRGFYLVVSWRNLISTKIAVDEKVSAHSRRDECERCR